MVLKNTYKQATITENISLWEDVWSNTYIEQATITENISLWEGVWSNTFNKYNNRKYFTLGGCPYSNTYKQTTITENISLCGCLVQGEQARSILGNETTSVGVRGVRGSEGTMRGARGVRGSNNRKYFTLGGCLFLKGQ